MKAELSIKKKYSILFILGALSALGPFSIDMYLPAFPAIALDLHTSVPQVTLSLTAYFIGISVGQLIYGPITDKYGRKKPLLVGLTIFLLASVGCALAPTIGWLITFRILLALGGCVGMVVSRAVVRDIFPASEIAKIFSTLMLIVGAAPILAPTIGGWIQTITSWRYIFYFLTLFSALLIFAVYFLLKESFVPNKNRSLNIKHVTQDYYSVFSDKTFLYFALAGSFCLAGMFTYISSAPFVFMKYFNFSESQFGIIFGVNALGYILGSQLNRFLLEKYTSFKIITMASLYLLLIAVALLLGFAIGIIEANILMIALFAFLFISGLIVPNTTALALMTFENSAGTASALIGFIQMVCGTIMSGMISLLHNNTLFPMVFIMAFCGITSFSIIAMIRKNQKKMLWQPVESDKNA